MDENKKTFILKNSILLTVFIFFITNINNLITFNFNFDKKNEVIIFVLLLIIYTPFIIISLIQNGSTPQVVSGGTPTTTAAPPPPVGPELLNEIIKFIQGKDSIDKDTLKTEYVYEIFLALIFTLFIAYSVLIFKYDTTFTKTQSFILFIFTTSLLFLFCRNIVTIILNLLTKSRTPNLIFSIKLFFILNLVYFITYFYFYIKQKKDRETSKKNSIN